MYKQIASNKRKSLALLVGFLVLYGALGLGCCRCGSGRPRS